MTRSRNSRSRRTSAPAPPPSAHEPLASSDQNRSQPDRLRSEDDDHFGSSSIASFSSKPPPQESRENGGGFTPYMAARARELKEEGNRRFQRKDYRGAMEEYDLALKLTPSDHPERAVFHSNRAACLMHLDPPRYDLALHECDRALRAHPGFARALLRRSRAYEALGQLRPALRDAEELLRADPNHPDALDVAKRVRASIAAERERGADGNGYGDADADARGVYSADVAVRSSRKHGTRSRQHAKVRVSEPSEDDAKIRVSEPSEDDAKIRVSEPSEDDAKIRVLERSGNGKRRGSERGSIDARTKAPVERSDRVSERADDAKIRVSERADDAKIRVSERADDAKLRVSERADEDKVRVSERADDAKIRGSSKPNDDAPSRISEKSCDADVGASKQLNASKMRPSKQPNAAKIEIVEQSDEMRNGQLSAADRSIEEEKIFDGVMESPVDSSSIASSRAPPRRFGEEEDGTLFTPCASSSSRGIEAIATSMQESISISYSSSSSSPSSSSSSSSSVMIKAEGPERSQKDLRQEKAIEASNEEEATSHPASRPLKLIYDHDIRLSEMPLDCTFGELRKIVKERFPSARSILIKYKDLEGDLVTITSTKVLRLAESASSALLRMANSSSSQANPHVVLDQLRLHVVEVPPDQEPRDEEEIASPIEAGSSADKGEEAAKESTKEGESIVAKELTKEGEREQRGEEFDKWLADFARLFQTHLGVDPNGHVELQDRGMELVAEALEEVVTGDEEAHKLFAAAMEKFKEVVVLGYVNWGNVYMCMARKQFKASSSHGEGEGEAGAGDGDGDGDGEGIDFCTRLQASFDWAQSQYELAEEKFEQSLLVKPDSIDALLGLGQKEFESAKLHWSLAVASRGADLRAWDPSKMLELFCSAEKRMERAAEIVLKQESEQQTIAMAAEVAAAERRIGEKSDRAGSNHDQDVAIKPQIYLFWGNILYEHSQVEFRLQMPSWKQLLDDAVHRFEEAGASPSDIATALETHLSRSLGFFSSFADAETQEQGLTVPSNGSSSGFSSSFVVDAGTQEQGLTETSNGSSSGLSSTFVEDAETQEQGLTETSNGSSSGLSSTFVEDAETQEQGLTMTSNGSSSGLSSTFVEDAETQEQGLTVPSNGSSSGFSPSFVVDAETQEQGLTVTSDGDGVIDDEAPWAQIELPAVSGSEMRSKSTVVGHESADGVIVGSDDNDPSLISPDASVLEKYDDDLEDRKLIQGCFFQRQTEMPQIAAPPDDTKDRIDERNGPE